MVLPLLIHCFETEATNEGAHAEGYATIAHGNGAHSEGFTTLAIKNGAHAEGQGTIAYGHQSHAEGTGYITQILVTGDANATTYSYTLKSGYNDEAIIAGQYLLISGYSYTKITNIDKTQKTITVENSLQAALNGRFGHVISSIALGEATHV